MRQLVFFLEEQSAQAMLESLLPRVLPADVSFRCIAFEGKQDLEKQLGKRISGWMQPDSHFVVMRDQDSGECFQIKERLTNICMQAGRPDTLVRIVCHELESWYLGDLEAVERALEIKGLSTRQRNKKFRQPDRLENPKQELRRLTTNHYQQISGSRAIGRHLSLENNCSVSFHVFISGIKRLLEKGTA